MYIHFTFTAGIVVACVRLLNRLDAHSYTECFRMLFATVKKDHTKFAVGESLLGVITDWSDQQINGLAEVVGEKAADGVVKGCQVSINQLLLCTVLHAHAYCTCVYRTLELISVPHQ